MKRSDAVITKTSGSLTTDGEPMVTAADYPNWPVVIIVDDDASMRAALRRLFVSADVAVELYASGTLFLAQAQLDRAGCLILDVSMPDMSGIEVHARLKERGVGLPVVFLTGSSDIPIAVAAMREGAVDFIEKPFDSNDLVLRVRKAIERYRYQRQEDLERREILRRLGMLTVRESSGLELVVTGRTSKEIARILAASHRTIENHRTRIMEKMRATTLADLVRLRLLAGGEPGPSSEREKSYLSSEPRAADVR